MVQQSGQAGCFHKRSPGAAKIAYRFPWPLPLAQFLQEQAALSPPAEMRRTVYPLKPKLNNRSGRVLGLGEGRLSMDKRDEELELGEGQFSDDDDESRIEELERRIDELESTPPVTVTGLSLGYAMGLSLAMVLSWSRNASILWCLLHGLCSWVYVIYFALTR